MAVMRGLFVILLQAAMPAVHAQLRPRRVGTSALGEQQEIPEVPAGNAGFGADDASLGAGMEALAKMAGGGADGLAGLADNPMLKNLMDSSPELAQLMSDPEALQAQMGQMAKLMNSDEGRAMGAKMMQDMQEVLTDPEKLQAGLQQLTENPELKGLADAVPGLREMMDDPVKMQEQVQKTAELFQKMGDPEAMKEMLEKMGVDASLLENLGSGSVEEAMQMAQKLMAQATGGDSEALNGLLGNLGSMGSEDGGELKDRVQAQLASLMQQRGGGDEEAAAEIDDEF